jgi:hypothetical protein
MLSSVIPMLRSNAYASFIAVGVVWGVVAWAATSPLVLWATATLIVAGVLLKVRPGERITWSWAIASASLGFLVSAYQSYEAASLLSGPLATVAAESLAGFAVFALVHLFLLYAGSRPGAPKL